MHLRVAAIAVGFLLALGGSPFAGAGAAAAEPGGDPIAVVRHIFEVADRDGSGSLSRREYGKARLDRFGVGFDECDSDGDGETSLAEYLAVYERYHPPAGRVEL